MNNIITETQRKNARYIYTFLNTQGNDLKDLNTEDTLFAALLSAPGTQQVKFIYGMGLGMARIGIIYRMEEKSLRCIYR